MGFTDEELEVLEQGGLLHDIGKLDMPASILSKPGPLDENECRIMRTHPQVGYDLLRSQPRFADAAEWCSRTTRRATAPVIRGGSPPRASRRRHVLAVADAYDSMTHPHTQRPAMPPRLAVEEIAALQRNAVRPAARKRWASCSRTRWRAKRMPLFDCLQDLRSAASRADPRRRDAGMPVLPRNGAEKTPVRLRRAHVRPGLRGHPVPPRRVRIVRRSARSRILLDELGSLSCLGCLSCLRHSANSPRQPSQPSQPRPPRPPILPNSGFFSRPLRPAVVNWTPCIFSVPSCLRGSFC